MRPPRRRAVRVLGRCLLAVAAALVLIAPANATAGPGPATAVQLEAPRPDWYTPALHRRVVAASAHGDVVPLPDGVDYPASGLAFTGIRPGAWMVAPAGCTMNFVFGSRRNYFIGTAGHCTKVGQRVTLVAAPGVLMNIGRTVKSVNRGIGNDFALVDVRPKMERYVNPSMAHFGGPTRVGRVGEGDVVEHSGHGLVIGTAGTPRAGVVVYRGPGRRGRGAAYAWAGAA
ncbi:MAG: S1 family peptidase, partial [Actinomycetota bacterium]|nr:S1 family peptidase [Actinomycetota bacterium]